GTAVGDDHVDPGADPLLVGGGRNHQAGLAIEIARIDDLRAVEEDSEPGIRDELLETGEQLALGEIERVAGRHTPRAINAIRERSGPFGGSEELSRSHDAAISHRLYRFLELWIGPVRHEGERQCVVRSRVDGRLHRQDAGADRQPRGGEDGGGNDFHLAHLQDRIGDREDRSRDLPGREYPAGQDVPGTLRRRSDPCCRDRGRSGPGGEYGTDYRGRRCQAAPGQVATQPLAAPREPAPDRPDWAPQVLRRLLVGPALQVAEHDGHSVTVGETVDLLVEDRGQL